MKILGKGRVEIYGWTSGVDVELEALLQLGNVASLPFVHSHIAVMPDVHWGCGATVGSVIPTIGAIVPAAVGVDIGCGMMAVKTSLTAADLPDNLFALRSAIEEAIPHGRSDNGGQNDKGAHENGGELSREFRQRLAHIVQQHPQLERACRRAGNHMGTLGTGNHFIEICLDESQQVWVMLHSGSRGIGNAIGTYFISKAKEDMRRWFINLPDIDLAYIPEGSDLFNDYIEALTWAQEYAKLNRETMMRNVLATLIPFFSGLSVISESDLEMAVNCHHNYVSREKHFGKNVLLTRKGALSARRGQLGIIPGSMGAKSFIVRGKGNLHSFQSCSHGAGRKMSRTDAKKIITLDDHIRDTLGVECRKDSEVIDESPGAYKDIDSVMKAQEDLVEIVHTLKQVLCVKG